MSQIKTEFQWRKATTDADLQDYADMCALLRPDRKTTVQEQKDIKGSMPPEANYEQYLFTANGEVVAGCTIMQGYWTPEKGLYIPTIKLGRNASKELCQFVFDQVTDRVKSLGGTKINFWIPTIHENMIQVIESSGYSLDQANPESMLDLDQLDLSQFQDSINSLLNSDLRVITLQDLLKEDPENGMRRYHELDFRLTKDIPLPWEFSGETFESFEKGFMLEQHTFDTIQVVLDGDFLVATSMLFRNRYNPIYFLTGLTGVDRGYRRRGIATALKAMNFNLAKEKGGKFLFSDNEENNPMLQLNYQLGFKPYWMWHSYTKEL
jgi:mycothiol synthase